MQYDECLTAMVLKFLEYISYIKKKCMKKRKADTKRQRDRNEIGGGAKILICKKREKDRAT